MAIKCPKYIRMSNSSSKCYIDCSNDGTLKNSIRLEWFNPKDRKNHKKDCCERNYKNCTFYNELEEINFENKNKC